MKIARQQDMPWRFSAVYASPNSKQRRELWNELSTFASMFNGAWLPASDFNDNTSLDERHGGSMDMQQ